MHEVSVEGLNIDIADFCARHVLREIFGDRLVRQRQVPGGILAQLAHPWRCRVTLEDVIDGLADIWRKRGDIH